jgi:type III restriction enzyme
MAQPLIERIVADFEVDAPDWTTFDFENFSRNKRLWDYQQNALQGAMKALWKYYEDFRDYRTNEADDYDDANKNANVFRKSKLWSCYEDNGLAENLDYRLDKKNVGVLSEYFTVNADKIAFKNFINRMSFWMATGSGKTLVIVKLIHLLHTLITRQEIPANDILVLAHREELLEQFRVHVREFNAANFGVYIRLRDLKEYGSAKQSNPELFTGDEVTVFTYRSDNIGFEQKDKIIDFRNYENGGEWYVLLDEAHKGDKEESKRQHIYSILSRNGFLFNFSATFTDPRDIYTTVSNFNLAEFVSRGYGKHISILKRQILEFRKGEDFDDEEKQKIVLQSLLMLTLVTRASDKARAVNAELFHKPLLITLVNSVNTEDADLKLFFRELERIARDAVSDDLFQSAKDELWEELKDGIEWMFEGETHLFSQNDYDALTIEDVRQSVFNTNAKGAIEVLRRPSDRKEIAFKIQNAERPFALIKIGDVLDWLKNDLSSYEIEETFNDEGYFENLNEDSSDIKILMGSRTFYEGWDSNRPNVINFINIGTGTDARKFVLQSIGRGVRVEPLPHKRRRIAQLLNAKEIDQMTFQAAKAPAALLESLFIFGTNRDALEKVVEELKKEKLEKSYKIELDKNTDITLKPLLIPTYRNAANPIITQKTPKKFEVLPSEIEVLKNYVDFVGDDNVLLLRHRTAPKDFLSLQQTIADVDKYYEKDKDARAFKNVDLLWENLIGYFNLTPKEFYRFKELEDEITHYKQILVTMKDISDVDELKRQIDKVKNFKDVEAEKARLKELYQQNKITLDELLEQTGLVAKSSDETAEYTYNGAKLVIKRFASHYYVPSIVSTVEKVSFIKHIVKVESERIFLERLSHYLGRANRFGEFDDWAFSKLDEFLDNVVIPYVDKLKNINRNFNPDFIFWLKRGEDYSIVLVDPKGIQNTGGFAYKMDGYIELFTENKKPKVFKFGDLKVRVFAFLFTKDKNIVGAEVYPQFWIDKMDDILDKVLAETGN